MNEQNTIYLGRNSNNQPVLFNTSMACRHGLIAGATGTGKTVSLQLLAESFAKLGVPVFTADVKGDLSGIALPGSLNDKISARLTKLGKTDFNPSAAPVLFWDIFAKSGHPLKTTIIEMGPQLLSRIMDLNDTQTDVMHIIFKYADDQGLLLTDLKDLQELIKHLSENSSELKKDYGNLATSSLATIQRSLITLGQKGGEIFFGEPAIDIKHLLQKDFSGHGVVSVLDARSLLQDRTLYSTFLLWLLSELFENLPEIGDQTLPKLVFFFDEAHLLFKDTPKALVEKIETVVRLIRSKGVGVYFITQNPQDIPESVLAQLGNRFIHALRAYTADEQKDLKTAARSFRANPSFDTAEAISNLEVGEALVSTLDSKGTPQIVERTLIAPPQSRLGSISEEERKNVISRSPLMGTYEKAIDRESAYEVLKARVNQSLVLTSDNRRTPAPGKPAGTSNRQGAGEAFAKSMVRSVGSAIGRTLIAVATGALLGKAASGRRKKSVADQFTGAIGSNIKRNVSNQIGNQIARGILGSILKR